MEQQELQVILASPGYEADLLAEIKFNKTLSLAKRDGHLFWVKGKSDFLWWPQWQLQSVTQHKIESISQAVRILRSNGKNWLNLDYKFHRRSALIQDGLPKFKISVLTRGEISPSKPCGAWFLEESGVLNISKTISIPYANGIIPITEDKEAPSRAYQKLDEVFFRIGKCPQKKHRVIDMGSYPGGWTWVLSQLADRVISVDTVALDGKVAQLKNIEVIKKDAFKVNPKDIGPVDWFFSDIICEPARLYKLISDWRDSGLVKNFVCTIKFKGTVDFELLSKFQSIPNSQIFHLNANKHELTWVCLA